MSIFNYQKGDSIDEVYSVDTGTVIVSIVDEERLRSLQVNHLVVLRSSKAGQHLVGIIDKITRKTVIEPIGTNEEDIPEGTNIVENIIRVTLIGTFLDQFGTTQNVFRRTLETVPEIDADCFVLEGERLTDFMKSVSKYTQDGMHPLSLGVYTINEDAEAWLDGNKYFQRHAVIVGSTGSGKSWRVARILEQIADLQNANAILLDIHGEYAPIQGDGIQHFRVAGPGDLGAAKDFEDGVLFLPYWLLAYEEMLALLLNRSDQNAPNQTMLFARSVTNAKRMELDKMQKSEILANFTVDSPVPYSLKDVVVELTELNNEREVGPTGR